MGIMSCKESSLFKILSLICIGFILAGCKLGPNFTKPNAPNTLSYTEKPLPKKTIATAIHGGASQHYVPEAHIPAQWWELFHSPSLNTLIEEGLRNSPTLQAAEATLVVAQQNLRAQIGGTMLPAFVGGFGASNRQLVPFDITSGVDVGAFRVIPTPFNLYNASVTVSYTLDIFGGLRRNIEAYRAQVDYQYYQLLAAYLSLSSNIVTSAISEATLREQIKATKEIIEIQEKGLEIIKHQFELGGASSTDVYTQQTTLEQTRGLLPALENRLAQMRTLLTTLIGVPPGTVLPIFYLDDLTLPTELPVSLPFSLVQQRPDIAASEALVHAACAQIGVATANMLPALNINSSTFGSIADYPAGLFGPNSTTWILQSQVLQTLFNGGALWATRKATIANYDAIFAQYKQTVLNALKNVSDSLQALEYDAESLHIRFDAEQAAKKTLYIATEQYKLGGIDYISLLTAEQKYRETYLERILAQGLRYADTAALFQAMGGGWWNAQVPESAGVSEKIILVE